MRGGNPSDYKNRRFNIPDIYRKWKSRYDFDSEEIQNLDNQGPDCVYSEFIDLGVNARAPNNPYIVGSGNNGAWAVNSVPQSSSGVSGRAFRIIGMTNSSKYDYSSNTGGFTLDTSTFVLAWINKPGSESNYILCKHGHGYRGDFKQLYLFWPQQSTKFIRIEVYRFDDMPWQNGDAAT